MYPRTLAKTGHSCLQSDEPMSFFELMKSVTARQLSPDDFVTPHLQDPPGPSTPPEKPKQPIPQEEPVNPPMPEKPRRPVPQEEPQKPGAPEHPPKQVPPEHPKK